MPTDSFTDGGQDAGAATPVGLALLVEDDAAYAEWLARGLQRSFPSLDTVAVARVADALAVLEQRSPTLALVDLHLPDGSGVAVIAMLGRAHPEAAILVITSVEDAGEALQAIEAGAHGYVLKSRSDWDLEQTVAEVLGGGSPITPSIARRVLQEFKVRSDPARPVDPLQPEPSAVQPTADSGPAGPPAPVAANGAQLSAREDEIFRLAARGYRNKEIAVRLGVSSNTVATHIKNVYRKLSVSSRTHLRHLLDDGR